MPYQQQVRVPIWALGPRDPLNQWNPLPEGAGTLRKLGNEEGLQPSHLIGEGSGAGPEPLAAQGAPLAGGHLASLRDTLAE